MKEYLKALNKTTETILGNAYSSDELDRFSKADYRWADNRGKSFQHRTVKRAKYISLNLEKTIFPKCLMSIEDL